MSNQVVFQISLKQIWEFEADMTTIVVPVRFSLGNIPKISTGLHPNSIDLFMHKSIILCHNINSITKQLPNMEP